MRTAIGNPGLAAFIVAATVAAGLFLAAGFAELGARRAAAPVVLAVEKAALEEALNEAPWISSGEGAPILWVLSEPGCAPCRRLETEILPKLVDRGVQARVIVAAPRAKQADEAGAVAALAQARDWLALTAWTAGRAVPGARALEPAAEEGYLEWGRASRDRLSNAVGRNGLTLRTPALFWRDGPEWRALMAPDARGLALLQAEAPLAR